MEPRQAFAETGKWMDSVDLENTVKNRFKAGQSQAMFCLSEKSPKSCAVLLLVNPPGGTNQWTSGKLQSIGPALSSDQVEHARDRAATPESGPRALHAVPEQLVALPTRRPPPEQQLLLFRSPWKTTGGILWLILQELSWTTPEDPFMWQMPTAFCLRCQSTCI